MSNGDTGKEAGENRPQDRGRNLCAECGLPPVTGYPNYKNRCYYCRTYHAEPCFQSSKCREKPCKNRWSPDSGRPPQPPGYTVEEITP